MMQPKLLAPILPLLLACTPAEQPEVATDTAPASASPSRFAAVEGFSTPEAVRYDDEQNVFFVANINGNPSAKDNNGFISRVRADGTIDSLRFIAGGRGGVTLHAPKGMAIVGDTLWVADIDALRGFNKRTGAAAAVVEFTSPRARFLNDVAAAPDGSIYVTDTGIEFDESGQMSHPGPDRVFRVEGRTPTVAIEGSFLNGPNGVTWDAASARLLIAPFNGTDVMAWVPGEQTPIVLATGPGQYDGIEILSDGRTIVSSWADSSIHVITPTSGSMTRLISNVPAPADIGVDTRNGRVAVPLFMDNRVEIWSLR